MFANVSNHPKSKWPEAQRTAAEAIGGPIVDVPFPQVDPAADTAAVLEIARTTVEAILASGARAALVEGEFTLTYAMVQLLTRAGIACYAATTVRMATEAAAEDGGVDRRSHYRFVALRRYPEVP